MKSAVLILGATSQIAQAAAEELAEKGYPLFLAGRDREELLRIADHLTVKYAAFIRWGEFDADRTDTHISVVHQAVKEMGGIGGALLAFGNLGDQRICCEDIKELQIVLTQNFVSACAVLHELANYFQEKRSGFIAAIASVAGDRGRQSNYVYGAAKGGLAIFLQGLRNRLYHAGVRVLTIKPGFVDTSMTFGKQGVFLAASPSFVGKKIVKAIESGKDVVYIPSFWKYLMLIIRSIPETLFKRMRL